MSSPLHSRCPNHRPPGPPYHGDRCRADKGHDGECRFRTADECEADWERMNAAAAAVRITPADPADPAD